MYMLFWRKKKKWLSCFEIYLTCTPFSHLDVRQVYLGSISSTCLCTAFTLENILKAQKAAWVSLFALLGYACIKAACKILLKLTPSQRWGRETLIIIVSWGWNRHHINGYFVTEWCQNTSRVEHFFCDESVNWNSMNT